MSARSSRSVHVSPVKRRRPKVNFAADGRRKIKTMAGPVDAVTDVGPRFQLIDDNELTQFIDSADSDNTKKQIKYSMSVFDEFCKQADAVDYDDIDNAALDILLSKFYAGARNKQGKLYSKKSVQSIRYGIQRHFLAKRGIDIVKGSDFPVSNKAFKALLVKLKQEGKASVQRHPTITKPDMDRIQSCLDISTASGLQHKVFVDIMVYFANRGMENLRVMKPDDFVLHTEAENNREFFTLRDMGTKNHSMDDEESQGGRMYSIQGNPRCPVVTQKKYLEKLNPRCQWMWQRPKKNVEEEDDVWYDNSPVGRDSLSNMMKKISIAAGCSKIYTNHCLRATTCTLLDHAGCKSRDIMSVSGHKSETSIKHYVRTSEETKEEMSDIISATLNQPGPSTVTTMPGDRPTGPSTSVVATVPNTEVATEAEEPLSLSQVEKILNDISNNPNIVQDVNAVCNVSNQNPTAFNFHGCVVNIYNK